MPAMDAATMLSSRDQNAIQYYSWHLSLRVDRPVEGCAMRPHAYMYSKKLDERDLDKPLPSHSKKMRDPPPHHEFSYRWFRGPPEEHCAWGDCPRRTSFSPHDWSLYALGTRHGVSGLGNGMKKAAACRLQCVSQQSSLHLCTFCNSKCFRQAWKTQYTIPKNNNNNYNSNSRSATPTPMYGGPAGSSGAGGGTLTPSRSGSFDETQSVGSSGSGGQPTPGPRGARSPVPPGTPARYNSSGYNNSNSYGNNTDYQDEEWLEVSRDPVFIPGPDDIGRKLKLEAAAYSHESGERLMFRVVKTDLVLARAPDPPIRSLVVVNSNNNNNNNINNPASSTPGLAKNNNAQTTLMTTQTSAANLHPYHGNPGARFRVVSYNVLAEIYATQQQYPYCDFWALSWDYRCVLLFCYCYCCHFCMEKVWIVWWWLCVLLCIVCCGF